MIADSMTLVGNCKCLYDKDPTRDLEHTLMFAVKPNSISGDFPRNMKYRAGIWKSTCAILAFDHIEPT